MPTATRANTFTSGGTILSAEVNEDLNDLFALVNDELIHADGTNAFTAVPSGPSTDPSTDNQYARKAYVDGQAGGIVVRDTIDTSGAYATLYNGAQNTWSQVTAFDNTISEKADHWYRATVSFPVFTTNVVFTKCGALIKREATSLRQGWVVNAGVSDGVTLEFSYDRKATATASADWEVWVSHSSTGNAAVQHKSSSTIGLATFTIEDLGKGV